MESSKTITFVAAAIVLALLLGAGALLGLFDQGAKSTPVPDTAIGSTPDAGTEAGAVPTERDSERPKPIEASKFRPERTPSPDIFLGDGPRVAGRVVNERGEGIAAAELRLIRDLSQVRSQSQLGEILTRTRSKDDGSFSMPVERNAYFVIQAVHESYASVLSSHIDPQTPESLNQTIRMQSGFPVLGMVSLVSGPPVEGAVITVFDISKQVGQGQSEPHPERISTSNAEGRFSLQHLTPGLKRILVKKMGLATDGVNAFTVKDTSTNPELHFVLDAGLTIAGRVLDARTQLPLAGAEVTARAVAMTGARERELRVELPAEHTGEEGDPDEARAQGFEQSQQARVAMQRFRDKTFLNLTAVTDENGQFVLEGALEARYQITTLARGYQRHSGTGANAGQQDVLIPLTPSARISGICVDSQTGKPVKAFQLVLSPTPDPQYFPIQGRQSFEDEEGRFDFTDARVGDSYLVARAPGYAGGIGGPFAIVSEGVIDGAVVHLEKGVTVEGTIVDQDSAPLSGASVSLVKRSPGAIDPGARIFQELINSQVRGGAFPRAVTDAMGRWKVEGVLAGTYEAKVERIGYSPKSGEAFSCEREGAVIAPSIQMEKGASIFGTIKTPEDQPDSEATVMITGIDVVPPYSSSATTSRDGTFRVTGLRPGTYRLVLAQAKGQFDLLAVLQSREDNTNIVTVVAGQEVEAIVRPPSRPR